MASAVRIRRIYDPPAAADGYRVLVDRLWPRGLRRETAAVDEWLKDVAPPSDLRAWYGPLTLLTATRDVEHSHAAVLAEAVAANVTPS